MTESRRKDCCPPWRGWKSVRGPMVNLRHPAVLRPAVILRLAGSAMASVATIARGPAEDSPQARASRLDCASFAGDLLAMDAHNYRRAADRTLRCVRDPRHSSAGEATLNPLAIRSAPGAEPAPSEPIPFLLPHLSQALAKG